jgi:hypothetical protein
MQDTNYKLRAWMGANRVSGRKLAEMIRMPYDTFKIKMAGRTEWKLSEIYALMKATGLAFDELF